MSVLRSRNTEKISRCNRDRHAIISDDGDARDACAACIVEIFSSRRAQKIFCAMVMR